MDPWWRAAAGGLQVTLDGCDQVRFSRWNCHYGSQQIHCQAVGGGESDSYHGLELDGTCMTSATWVQLTGG